MRTTIALAMSILVAGALQGATEITGVGNRSDVSIFLTVTGKTLVQEESQVALRDGLNVITASWASDKIDRGTLLLTSLDSDAGLEISGAILPRAAGKTVQWEVVSPSDQLVTLRALYQVDNLTCTPEYEVLFPTGEAEVVGLPAPAEGMGGANAEFSAQMLVGNGTGKDLPSAGLYISDRCISERPIAAGEAVRLTYERVENMPLVTSLVLDATRYGQAIALEGEISNTVAAGLGTAPLPAGKLRAYHVTEGDAPTLVGESTLEDLAVGESGEVFLGFQQDLRVKRDQLAATQVNVRRDRRGRAVVYDVEQTIKIEFENPRPEDLVIRVIEQIEGEWQIVRSSHRYEKLDATSLEFAVPVPADDATGEPSILEFTVRRKKVAP